MKVEDIEAALMHFVKEKCDFAPAFLRPCIRELDRRLELEPTFFYDRQGNAYKEWFCKGCGSKLYETVGEKVISGGVTKFCPECGQRLKWNTGKTGGIEIQKFIVGGYQITTPVVKMEEEHEENE